MSIFANRFNSICEMVCLVCGHKYEVDCTI